jgi:uncharacterized damage-inducible protein DinB
MTATEFLNLSSQQVNEIANTVKESFTNLTDEALNRKAHQHSWSILECFEHLNRYNAYYLDRLEMAIANAAEPASESKVSTWIGKKSISMMHPSNKTKHKTFKKMNPASSALSRSVLETFLSDQERLLSIIRKATGSNIYRKSVAVEFFKLLRMTVAETIEFTIVHEQRHLLQAQRLLPAAQALAS